MVKRRKPSKPIRTRKVTTRERIARAELLGEVACTVGKRFRGEAPIMRRIRERKEGKQSKFLTAIFDEPEDGWIGFRVQSDGQDFFQNLSYTPFDSFRELATALSLLLHDDSESEVHWNQGPSHFQFHFERSTDQVTLSIFHHPCHNSSKYKAEAVFKLTGTYADICLPFWTAICDLRSCFSDAELSRRWHRDFPGRQFDRLRDRMRTPPSAR